MELVDDLNKKAIANQDGGMEIQPFRYLYAGDEHYINFEEHCLWDFDNGGGENIDEVRDAVMEEYNHIKQALMGCFKGL